MKLTSDRSRTNVQPNQSPGCCYSAEILILLRSDWDSYPGTLDRGTTTEDGGDLYLVYQCDSPLALRLALREPAAEGAVKVLITGLDEQSIDQDILLRLAKHTFFPINSWQIAKSLFGASSVDPPPAQTPLDSRHSAGLDASQRISGCQRRVPRCRNRLADSAEAGNRLGSSSARPGGPLGMVCRLR